MVWIDYTIIILISISSLIGVIRGFVRESVSIISWSCAFVFSIYFYPYVSVYITYFNDTLIKNSMTIVFLFILTLIIGSIVNYMLSALIERTGLSGADSILGCCFGIVRGILIMAAFLFFLDTVTMFRQSESWKSSILIPQFIDISKWFVNYLKNI